jgi:hypothetical protein
MTTRRDVLFGGALVLSFGTSSFCACHAEARSPLAPHTSGCWLAEADVDRIYPHGAPTAQYATGEEPLHHSSGDRDFDRALVHTLAKCADLLQVLPGFAFFDDSAAPNAYATNRVRMQRADGTVIFGKTLLRELLRRPEAPDACVASVCAHEFGHILQFKTGLAQRLTANQPTVKRLELHADFLAGYFAGTRKKERQSFPAAVFAMTQYMYGDTGVNNPQHHGTHEQRGAAVVHGFEASYRQHLGLSDAIQQGINHVMRQ